MSVPTGLRLYPTNAHPPLSINLFQMAFAGFFVNLSSIPPVLRWLQYVAPLKYTLEALTVNEVGAGLMITDVLAGAKVQISAEIIMETLCVHAHCHRRAIVPRNALGGFPAGMLTSCFRRGRRFGFQQSAYYRDVLVLCAFIVGFAVILTMLVMLRLRELR